MSTEYISLNQIWNSDISEVEDTIISMEKQGFTKIIHDDPYVSLLCMVNDSGLISPEEVKILSNSSFINTLTASKYEHGLKLTLALYESEPTINSENLLEMESRILAAMPVTNLLEMTHGSDLLKICPLDVHSGNSIYDGDGNLLSPEAIFQYQGHCYDVDMIYRYIKEGGVIDLKQDYIDRFFEKKIDYSNQELTDEDASKITFHHMCEIISMYRNNMKTLKGVVFPNDNKILELNRNPITELNCKFSENLRILDISHTFIRNLVDDNIPPSLEQLNVENNVALISVSLSNCQSLKSLNLSGCTELIEINEDDLPHSLKTLNLTGCTSLRRINLKGLDINKVTVTGCFGLESFVSSECLNLRTLDFTGIDNCKIESDFCDTLLLEKTTFELLNEDKIPHLIKHLSLKGNVNLTKVAARKCIRLNSLNVEDCSALKQISKGSFSDKIKSIKVVKNTKIQLSPVSFFSV